MYGTAWMVLIWTRVDRRRVSLKMMTGLIRIGWRWVRVYRENGRCEIREMEWLPFRVRRLRIRLRVLKKLFSWVRMHLLMKWVLTLG